MVFVNFHGLAVAKERKLRGEFRKNDIKYKVAKKTLLKRVLPDMPELEGEVGIAVGYREATEAPRLISQFIKTEKDGLKILGGVYETGFVDAEYIKRLASIPSREVLLTQLAYILSQPMASLAHVLTEVEKTKK